MAEQAMIATVHERIREREIAAQAAINRGDAFTAIAELIGAFRLLATLTKGDTDHDDR